MPCTELFPVHRAFSCAQSFFLCTELSAVHRAFSCAVHRHRAFSSAQSFFQCTELFPVPCTGTELFPVHRAFSCAQSFFLCTELWGPKPVIPTNAFAAGNSCFTNSRVQKLKNYCTPEFYGGILYCFWKSKANSTFCKVVKQKGETLWHRKSHLLCKRLVPKLQNSAKPNSGDSLPVFCDTELRFGSLCNLGLSKKLRFSLQRHKTAKSCAFCDCTPEFYGGILFLLLEKQGKLYFLQSSQTKGRGETNFFDA